MTKNEKFDAIIAFLEELPESKFDYSKTVTEHENGCGTVCCIIGWFPKIFPSEWRYADSAITGRICAIPINDSIVNSKDFLDITTSEKFALLFGDAQGQERLGLPITPDTSTLAEVIALLKAYREKYLTL